MPVTDVHRRLRYTCPILYAAIELIPQEPCSDPALKERVAVLTMMAEDVICTDYIPVEGKSLPGFQFYWLSVAEPSTYDGLGNMIKGGKLNLPVLIQEGLSCSNEALGNRLKSLGYISINAEVESIETPPTPTDMEEWF